MQELAHLLVLYGVLVVFGAVFLDECGLPVPSMLALLVAGAAYYTRPFLLLLVIVAAIAGSLLADVIWYLAGKHYGRRILSLVCRISLSPDTCVRQTEELYHRIGPVSLVFVRFLPGLSNIAVAMASISRTSFLQFLSFNFAGVALFYGLPALLGALFHSAIADILNVLVALGRLGLALVLLALLLYVLHRWWERMRFVRQLKMDRISVEELIGMIEKDQAPVILDVRSQDARGRDGIIPGAWPAHPNDINRVILDLGRETEIVIYCACPNEASAAIAAQHLRKAGFKKIRPLLGGVDAWVAAGRKLVLAT
jgi:membrane protein DedA with SNARE-associated domain/rhodanese-related sulfurtransferase